MCHRVVAYCQYYSIKEVEQAKLAVQLSSGKKIGGMLFTDDFVGVGDSKESLYIDTVISGD